MFYYKLKSSTTNVLNQQLYFDANVATHYYNNYHCYIIAQAVLDYYDWHNKRHVNVVL